LVLFVKSEQVFLSEVKRKFRGKWVSVKDGEVIAVCDTHDEVLKEIKRRGLVDVYIFYVPTEKEEKYEFLFRVFL